MRQRLVVGGRLAIRPLILTVLALACLGALGHSSRVDARAQIPTFASLEQCQELKRQGDWPKYTSSGAWTADGRLFLLDNAWRRLLGFSALGTSDGVVSGELAKRLAMGAPPTSVAASGNGFCIQTDENRFTLVGPQGRPKAVVAAPSEHGIISKVYNFTVAGDDVVAFGDVQESENQWQRGFVTFSATGPEAVRWLVKGISSTEERTFFRLSFPFISTIGKTAYILRMETRPELFCYRRVVEHSTMPVGLYVWEGRVYLLERSWPSIQKERRSFLALDSEAPGTELRSIPIKVNPDHLFVVPGRLRWSLVTKVHPIGLLTQQVPGIRYFNSVVAGRAFDHLAGRVSFMGLLQISLDGIGFPRLSCRYAAFALASPAAARGRSPYAKSIVERSSSPVGLYAYENRLYILLREASRDATLWSVMIEDPAKHKGGGSLRERSRLVPKSEALLPPGFSLNRRLLRHLRSDDSLRQFSRSCPAGNSGCSGVYGAYQGVGAPAPSKTHGAGGHMPCSKENTSWKADLAGSRCPGS